MLYRFLRAVADIALHWYYADIVVQGRDRIPREGPLIVVVNHPNALVDALVVGITMERRVLLTAKATLFEHGLLARVLRVVGVVPLRRSADERGTPAHGADATGNRNSAAFHRVTDALRESRVVLVFPEGISHDGPALAPLKTGTARMALAAQAGGVRGLLVLPCGLIFEQKERLRSRVLVRIGEPIDVDASCADDRSRDAGFLTARIDAALRGVTLNFASDARAHQAVELARILSAITDEPQALGRPRALDSEAEIAHRIEAATDGLASAPPAIARAADAFIASARVLEGQLAQSDVTLSDVRISPTVRHGLRFIMRETVLLGVALPVALLGRVTHWLPLRVARTLAMRSLVGDPSRDQPAMRTILCGLALVLCWYVIQAVFVARWLGAPAATLWLVTIFAAAHIDFALRERLRRATRRARTYLAFRADPALRSRALADIEALIARGLTLERALTDTHGSR